MMQSRENSIFARREALQASMRHEDMTDDLANMMAEELTAATAAVENKVTHEMVQAIARKAAERLEAKGYEPSLNMVIIALNRTAAQATKGHLLTRLWDNEGPTKLI